MASSVETRLVLHFSEILTVMQFAIFMFSNASSLLHSYY